MRGLKAIAKAVLRRLAKHDAKLVSDSHPMCAKTSQMVDLSNKHNGQV